VNIQEIIAEIMEHLRGMRRYRWWGIGVAWVISIAGCFAIYAMEDVYEASAKVYVDTQSLVGPVFEGLALRDNVSAQVEAVSRALLTRPNLEKVARKTDLDLRADSAEEMEILITDLQKEVDVIGNRERNVFDIAFTDPDRAKAKAVVAAIVEAFVEDSLQGQGDDATMAERALEAELQDHEDRLLSAESAVAEFKKQNLGYMPDDRGDYYVRLQAASQAVGITEEKIKVMQERRSELRRQIEGEVPVFGIMSFGPGQSAVQGCSHQDSVAQLEADLAELQVEFTPKHPRIISLRATISELEEECVVEQEAAMAAGVRPQSGSDQPLEANPVYQNLRIELSDTEVELASLRAQLATQRAQEARLREDVDNIAEVELNLKKLNRDYDVVQDRYQELLKRWETLRSKQRLDPVTDTVQFRTLEPPFASIDPVGPNRPLLLAGLLVIAVGAGTVVTFLLNQLKPVFYTRRAVRNFSGLPLLGSVSLLMSPQEQHSKRMWALGWVAACLALILFTGVAMVFEDSGAAVVRRLLGGYSV
jgi:polysaccharide chain length determinant protein (PEP-CTERM system associated)